LTFYDDKRSANTSLQVILIKQ